MGVQKDVVVSVVKGKTSVKPDPVNINIDNQDEVVWLTDQNKQFTVTFKKDKKVESPFDLVEFKGNKDVPAKSGRPKTKDHGKDFYYTVQVDGAAALDPVVHTDP